MAEEQQDEKDQQERPGKGESPPVEEAADQQPAAPSEAQGPDADQAEQQEPAEPQGRSAPALPEGKHYIWGTGRRKSSVARIRIRPGTGKFLINKREIDNYFTGERDRQAVITPLQVTHMMTAWDIWVNVKGGGITGQAGAVTLGLARAIAKAAPDVESALREVRLLTRDARMKERKKPGQKGARKKFQWTKR